jgi:hypothetical protein
MTKKILEKMNKHVLRFVPAFCFNRRRSPVLIMQDVSTRRQDQRNNRLEITSPEENALLNPKKQTPSSSG